MNVDVISDDSEDLLVLITDVLSVMPIFLIICNSLFLNFSPTKAYSTGLTQL